MTDRPTDVTKGLLLPGNTCWRIAQADRLAVIVDAADYFKHLRGVLRAANETIYLIGWDFDLRLEMLPGESDENGHAPDGLPNRLGEFLKHLVETQDGLKLYVLKWDKAMLVEIAQQAAETLELKLTSDRIQFALDSHHPTGATHHQKVVVVDDRMAFCGGIDVTGGRWDTREHAPDDPRRHFPNGKAYKPWHDVTTALTGPVAAALGDLARERWKAANGEDLEAPHASSSPWPDELGVDLEGVDVAIARTKPRYRDQDRIDEIERLYLAAIQRARHCVYLESQYFAAGSICEALEERLAEPNGPEVVVINPDRAEGYVEHQVMDTARARMIERLRAAAERGGGGPNGRTRFHILYPANTEGEPIYVHAKVLIVDDTLVRIGSSNINNRSMGFDTECDVAFEAANDAQHRFALTLRHDLLAEHMGCGREDVAEAVRLQGSVNGAIDMLNGRSSRRLCAIDPEPLTAIMRETGERILSDERAYPRNRPYPLRSITHGAKRAVAPYHFEAAGAGLIALAVGAVALGMWAGLRFARSDKKRTRLAAPAVISRYPIEPFLPVDEVSSDLLMAPTSAPQDARAILSQRHQRSAR